LSNSNFVEIVALDGFGHDWCVDGGDVVIGSNADGVWRYHLKIILMKNELSRVKWLENM
jgi:hypothetical protein